MNRVRTLLIISLPAFLMAAQPDTSMNTPAPKVLNKEISRERANKAKKLTPEFDSATSEIVPALSNTYTEREKLLLSKIAELESFVKEANTDSQVTTLRRNLKVQSMRKFLLAEQEMSETILNASLKTIKLDLERTIKNRYNRWSRLQTFSLAVMTGATGIVAGMVIGSHIR